MIRILNLTLDLRPLTSHNIKLEKRRFSIGRSNEALFLLREMAIMFMRSLARASRRNVNHYLCLYFARKNDDFVKLSH